MVYTHNVSDFLPEMSGKWRYSGPMISSMRRIALWLTWHYVHIATKLTVTPNVLVHRHMTYQNARLSKENCIMCILVMSHARHMHVPHPTWVESQNYGNIDM